MTMHCHHLRIKQLTKHRRMTNCLSNLLLQVVAYFVIMLLCLTHLVVNLFVAVICMQFSASRAVEVGKPSEPVCQQSVCPWRGIGNLFFAMVFEAIFKKSPMAQVPTPLIRENGGCSVEHCSSFGYNSCPTIGW